MEAKSNRRTIGFAAIFCKKSATCSDISGRIRLSASETVRSCCTGRYKLMPVFRLTSSAIFNSPGPKDRTLAELKQLKVSVAHLN